MKIEKSKRLFPKCPKCEGDSFELRIRKDEHLASARCSNCSSDYLLLDSKEYWFDVIQKGYPRVVRCSCNATSFGLQIDYQFRHTGDVCYLAVSSICSSCGKTKKRFDFDVKYSGTEHLVDAPLVPCANPKIFYDLNKLHLLINLPGITRIVRHLAGYGLKFFCYEREEGKWVGHYRNASEANLLIEKGKYLFIYAVPETFEVSEERVGDLKEEDSFWKRSEVIRIGSKWHVLQHDFGVGGPSIGYSSDPPILRNQREVGLQFNIDFSNEFISGEIVKSKSDEFKKATASLLEMLRREFVSSRGTWCFDDPEVHTRVFGDKYKQT